MNNVFVGSTNENKVNAVKKVFLNYNVTGVEASSLVSSQPKTLEETIEGAYNRCLSIEGIGIKIGLEAGVFLLKDLCYLVNFGVMIDEVGNRYYAGGTLIPLPNEVKDYIYNDNLTLKEAFVKYKKDNSIDMSKGTISYLTNNLVNREDIFVQIAKLLLGQLKH